MKSWIASDDPKILEGKDAEELATQLGVGCSQDVKRPWIMRSMGWSGYKTNLKIHTAHAEHDGNEQGEC